MKKRAMVVLVLMMFCMTGMGIKIYGLTTGGALQEAALQQSTSRLVVGQYRGMVYDCNGEALVNRSTKQVAAVAGGSRAADLLSNALSKESFEILSERLIRGTPFAIPLPEGLETSDAIDVLDVPIRYDDGQTAPHVIGYTNGSGEGVTGIERAFNDWLDEAGGEISVSYQVDAYGRALAAGREANNSFTEENKQGVVLTLDRQIQETVENIVQAHMDVGAVVINEVESGDIRAMVSAPDFSVNDLAMALEEENSPMLNRAVGAYNAGSVFKLITAAAALELGVSPDRAYDCTGVTTIYGRDFKCSNTQGHGMMDMEDALAQSCNHYYIKLAQDIGYKPLLEMAERFGLGREVELAPGMYAASGSLPTEKDLSSPHGLANFSFGQGDLMVTPLQICSVIQTIANNGERLDLSLVDRTVDRNGNTVMDYSGKTSTAIISSRTAKLLQRYMVTCVENGTGRPGTPKTGGSGAKTGTAETGWIRDGRTVDQAWYAGYYPRENPKYAIVVLTEDGKGGGTTSGPVFKTIADALYDLECVDTSP